MIITYIPLKTFLSVYLLVYFRIFFYKTTVLLLFKSKPSTSEYHVNVPFTLQFLDSFLVLQYWP